MHPAKDHPEHIDIELSRPIELGGVKVTSLRLREPTVNDNLIAQKTAADEAMHEAQLLANLASISIEDLRRLPVRDYKKMIEAYHRFTV